MAEPVEQPITFDQLKGIKQLRRVAALLSSVHQAGCGRDKAGNRKLHFDDYVLLILIYLFNPMIDSMRMLQKVSDLPELQSRLGIKRFSLGSFSESCRVFDPSMLQTVVDHHVPGAWEITKPKNTGKSDEKNVLRRNLSAGHTYVMDRWYAQFTLWNDIRAKGSSYVCRVRDNSVYDVIEDRPLNQQAIVTDLLDVPAHIIAFLYQYRWSLEIFFRFLKQILGCRHLLSTKIQGIQIQIYAAVICCLMLNCLTGRKPTKWMVTLMALYLQGLASDDDVLKELNKPDKTGIKLKAKDELWKKLGY